MVAVGRASPPPPNTPSITPCYEKIMKCSCKTNPVLKICYCGGLVAEDEVLEEFLTKYQDEAECAVFRPRHLSTYQLFLTF